MSCANFGISCRSLVPLVKVSVLLRFCTSCGSSACLVKVPTCLIKIFRMLVTPGTWHYSSAIAEERG